MVNYPNPIYSYTSHGQPCRMHASGRYIHQLFEWSVTWNLNFSQSKCCYIQVGPPSRSCYHSYMLNSTVIASTDKQKDLDIWIDPNLSRFP